MFRINTLALVSVILTTNLIQSQEFVEQYSLSGITKSAKGETVFHVLYAHTGPEGPKGPPTHKHLKVKLPDKVAAKLSDTLSEVVFLSQLARCFDRDVELDDHQKKLFKNINRQFRQESAKIVYKFGKKEINEVELVKKLKVAQDRVNNAKSKLLPHQTKRLSFLKARIEVDINGLVDSLTRGKLGKTLEIDSAQKKELQTIKREFEEELAKYVQELRKKARKKIVKKLKPNQLKKFKSIFGDSEIQESKEYMRKVIKRMLTYFRL